MNKTNPKLIIEKFSAEIIKPAGDAVEFSTIESIINNRKEFVIQCHRTWKKWHKEAVMQLLIYDAFARREKEFPIGPVVESFGEYNRAVWRRVNDAIIWTLFGMKRHVIKRLCLYRTRTYLSESNATSAMAIIDILNKDPNSYAIWNDATSCVDIGDITYIQNGISPQPQFIEIKDGKVNAEIIKLLQKENPEYLAGLGPFSQKYGKKGMDQISRFLRQKKVGEQMMTLLRDEKGTDPVTGQEIKVIESKSENRTYDDILNTLLKESITSKDREVFQSVDDCLWIYVNANENIGVHECRRRCIDKLSEALAYNKKSLNAKRPAWDKDRIVCLNDGLPVHVAKPIFLREIDSNIIGEIVYGKLMFRVYLYLDWIKYGEMINNMGAKLIWSEKEARKALSKKASMRPVIIAGKVPQIDIGSASLPIQDPNLVEIFFDGVMPTTMAAKIIETGHNISVSMHDSEIPGQSVSNTKATH